MEDDRKVFSLFGGAFTGLGPIERAVFALALTGMLGLFALLFFDFIYKTSIDSKAIERGYTQTILPGSRTPVWVKPAPAQAPAVREVPNE